MAVSGIDLGKYKLGWSDSRTSTSTSPKKGLNEDVVRDISGQKTEPEWMTKFRLNVAEAVRAQADARVVRQEHADHRLRRHLLLHQAHRQGQVSDWDMLPEAMKSTYEKLGIPEAERKFLAGVTAQYESEVVYHKNREDLERRGSCSPTWTPRCASTRRSSASTSAR